MASRRGTISSIISRDSSYSSSFFGAVCLAADLDHPGVYECLAFMQRFGLLSEALPARRAPLAFPAWLLLPGSWLLINSAAIPSSFSRNLRWSASRTWIRRCRRPADSFQDGDALGVWGWGVIEVI
ncbi:MAG: hypothetical protein IPI11_17775 [Haliscomenobacter sp.]|nr:hypothetical protein [Haliscomenobacter sp.]